MDFLLNEASFGWSECRDTTAHFPLLLHDLALGAMQRGQLFVCGLNHL